MIRFSPDLRLKVQKLNKRKRLTLAGEPFKIP
jgi:hypothetical protein